MVMNKPTVFAPATSVADGERARIVANLLEAAIDHASKLPVLDTKPEKNAEIRI